MSTIELLSKYFLEKLGEKFWIATLIPSVVMVVTSFVVFDPILNSAPLEVIVSGALTERLSLLFWVIFFSLPIAFTLYVNQTYIVNVHEGHGFPQRFSFLRNHQVRKAKEMLSKIDRLEKQIRQIENKGNRDLENKINTLKNEYYVVAGEYDRSFPDSIKFIMPTKLGNILKSAEQYSGSRYGMDSIVWWPRLYDLLPHGTKEKIEHTVNELYILLNFSSLSLTFYVLCLIAILFTPTIASSITSPIFLPSTIRYLSAGTMAVFFSGFINRLAVYSASAYTEQLRSAYDLYRFLLLDQMRIKLPKNSIDEFYLWKNLGELIVLGSLSLEFKSQSYDWQRGEKRQQASAVRTNIKKVAQSQRNG